VVPMSFVLGFVPFRLFSETLVQPYVLTYKETGYGFSSSTAAHNSQIFTIASFVPPIKRYFMISDVQHVAGSYILAMPRLDNSLITKRYC
jgi:hypothetical protein